MIQEADKIFLEKLQNNFTKISKHLEVSSSRIEERIVKHSPNLCECSGQKVLTYSVIICKFLL